MEEVDEAQLRLKLEALENVLCRETQVEEVDEAQLRLKQDRMMSVSLFL